MCGGSYVGRGMRHGMWRHAGGREYLGRDVEKMSPGTRISAALSVLLPVGLSGVFLVAFVPSLWWIFTTYFWVAFPAFGLLMSGIAALGEGRPVRVSEEERELLEAIRESGEIFVPSLWWIFTTYFWVAFPAFGLLMSGIAALGEGRLVRVSEEERELLEAI